jgi:hypothetical protein
MRLNRFLRFAGLAFALLLIPALASAQQSITCESNNGKRNYCGNVENSREVVMQRQLSQSSCVRNSSWGVDGRGLWVDHGCRAVFSFGYNGGGSGGGWWDPNPNDRWPPSGDFHGGNWGRGGACFYKDRNFGSSYFCMRRGEYRESLGGYGDDISSIRVFGGAHVTVYDDRDYRGSHTTTSRDIPDLRNWSVAGKGGHTWNNRISSVRIQ